MDNWQILPKYLIISQNESESVNVVISEFWQSSAKWIFKKNCDIEEIPPKKWKIGQIYNSKMKISKKEKSVKK
jgi:hypothetical protein